jgi:hypothetical protein
MKAFITSLIIISTFGCKDVVKLNNEIYAVQKQAVLKSPYRSASGTTVYVDAQKNFRLRTLPKLIRNKIFNPDVLGDTIFMTETFDAICINCPSDWMKVLIKDTIYSVRAEILGHKGGIKYNVEVEPFDPSSKDFQYKLRNSELIEIVSKIRNGNTWTSNPLQYGSDNCNDGDHTILTVIYPNKKIESLYVRCWTPCFYRNRK